MNTAITQLIKHLSALNDIQNAQMAGPILEKHLPSVLQNPNLLQGIDVSPDTNTEYNKITLYAHTGDNPWSIQALIWPPNAQTPIHNHKCFCTFAMYQGILNEEKYDENGTYKNTVSYTAGAIASMTPDGADVHRMVNTTDSIAVSLHFYGINGMIDNSVCTIFKDINNKKVA